MVVTVSASEQIGGRARTYNTKDDAIQAIVKGFNKMAAYIQSKLFLHIFQVTLHRYFSVRIWDARMRDYFGGALY